MLLSFTSQKYTMCVGLCRYRNYGMMYCPCALVPYTTTVSILSSIRFSNRGYSSPLSVSSEYYILFYTLVMRQPQIFGQLLTSLCVHWVRVYTSIHVHTPYIHVNQHMKGGLYISIKYKSVNTPFSCTLADTTVKEETILNSLSIYILTFTYTVNFLVYSSGMQQLQHISICSTCSFHKICRKELVLLHSLFCLHTSLHL